MRFTRFLTICDPDNTRQDMNITVRDRTCHTWLSLRTFLFTCKSCSCCCGYSWIILQDETIRLIYSYSQSSDLTYHGATRGTKSVQLLRVMSTQGNRPGDAWPYEFRMSAVSCEKWTIHFSLFFFCYVRIKQITLGGSRTSRKRGTNRKGGCPTNYFFQIFSRIVWKWKQMDFRSANEFN